MALSIVQAAVALPTNSSNIVFTLGSSPTPNNILLATCSGHTTQTITPPSGSWTQIFSQDSGDIVCAGFWYVVKASDPTTWTFVHAGGTDGSGGMVEITGANNTTPINAELAQNAGSTNTQVTPSRTPSILGCLALGMFGGTNDKLCTGISSGWTIQANGSDGANFQSNVLGSRNALTADTSTAINTTFTLASNDDGVSATILVAPAPASGSGLLMACFP